MSIGLPGQILLPRMGATAFAIVRRTGATFLAMRPIPRKSLPKKEVEIAAPGISGEGVTKGKVIDIIPNEILKGAFILA